VVGDSDSGSDSGSGLEAATDVCTENNSNIEQSIVHVLKKVALFSFTLTRTATGRNQSAMKA
jgi:hypothetical protein